jgi:hypothetical protein
MKINHIKLCIRTKLFVSLSAWLVASTLAFSINAKASAAETTAPLISGFIDAQYQYKKKDIDPGFVLNDAAIYLSGEFENVKGLIDLPFSGALGEDSSFEFAKGKAQAYLTVTASEGLEITAGQFDAIHGFEAPDGNELVFNLPGEVGGNFLPVSHLGLMISYAIADFSFTALVANSNNKTNLHRTDLTTSPETKLSENPEFGGQVGFDNESFRASAGILHHQIKGSRGAQNLYSLLAGISFDPVHFDIEADAKKIGSSDLGYGVMAHLLVQATAELSAAARGEWIRKVPNGDYEILTATFGPQYKMNEHVKFKVDYTWAAFKTTQDSKRENEHSANAGAVFIF